MFLEEAQASSQRFREAEIQAELFTSASRKQAIDLLMNAALSARSCSRRGRHTSSFPQAARAAVLQYHSVRTTGVWMRMIKSSYR